MLLYPTWRIPHSITLTHTLSLYLSLSLCVNRSFWSVLGGFSRLRRASSSGSTWQGSLPERSLITLLPNDINTTALGEAKDRLSGLLGSSGLFGLYKRYKHHIALGEGRQGQVGSLMILRVSELTSHMNIYIHSFLMITPRWI